MATIKEDYVSFETAKLLKEKGFDEPCECAYSEGGQYLLSCYNGIANRRIKNNEALDFSYNSTAPTLQMAMRWLREIHNIYIELNWDKGNELYSFQIWKPGKYQPEISSLDLWRIYRDDNYLGEWKYEESCEVAIKYCLEHLI